MAEIKYYGRLPLTNPSLLVSISKECRLLYRPDRRNWFPDQEGAFATVSTDANWQELTEEELEAYLEKLNQRMDQMDWPRPTSTGDEYYVELPVSPASRMARHFDGVWYLFDLDINDWMKDDIGVDKNWDRWERVTLGQAQNQADTMMSHRAMMVHQAIRLATCAHRDQVRKVSNVPAIAHCIEVAEILLNDGCSGLTVMAGLLHETVEDTTITLPELERQFGARVAQLVASVTEDKTASWEERKHKIMETMFRSEDMDLMMLSCADAVSNLRSIKADYAVMGDAIWDQFHRGKTSQRWYYRGMLDSLCSLEMLPPYNEMTNLFEELFVSFYINAGNNTIVQTDGESTYAYTREKCEWGPYHLPDPAAASGVLLPISRNEANEQICAWNFEQMQGTLQS